VSGKRGHGIIANSPAMLGQGNRVVGNEDMGIQLASGSNVTIEDNNGSRNAYGIYSIGSWNDTIRSNRIDSSSTYNVEIDSSTDIVVESNEIGNGTAGIVLFEAKRITMRGNRFTNDSVVWYGSSVDNFATHSISEDNLANGRPIVYYRDCDGRSLDGAPIGELLVANCTHIRASNLSFAEVDGAILMAYVDQASVLSSTVASATLVGIEFLESTNVSVISSAISTNPGADISIRSAQTVRIDANQFTGHMLSASGVQDLLFRGNSASGGGGTFVDVATNVTIEGNALAGYYDGISVQNGRRVVIENNTVMNMDGYGILASTNDTIVRRNRVLNASLDGIVLFNLGNALV